MQVALIAQLAEHCTFNTTVMGLNPIQSLKFFQVFFSSSVMTAFMYIIFITLYFAVRPVLQDASKYYNLKSFIFEPLLNVPCHLNTLHILTYQGHITNLMSGHFQCLQ